MEIKNYKNINSGNNTPSKMALDSPKKTALYLNNEDTGNFTARSRNQN